MKLQFETILAGITQDNLSEFNFVKQVEEYGEINEHNLHVWPLGLDHLEIEFSLYFESGEDNTWEINIISMEYLGVKAPLTDKEKEQIEDEIYKLIMV